MDKNRRDQQRVKLAVILGVAASIVAVIALGAAIWIGQGVKLRDEQHLSSWSQRAYDHSRLSFCYENQIRPCDDHAIQEFNDANGTNFSVGRPQLHSSE